MCKCTCGGCDCSQVRFVGPYNAAAAAYDAAPVRLVNYGGNAADWPTRIQFVPAAAAGAALPNVLAFVGESP